MKVLHDAHSAFSGTSLRQSIILFDLLLPILDDSYHVRLSGGNTEQPDSDGAPHSTQSPSTKAKRRRKQRKQEEPEHVVHAPHIWQHLMGNGTAYLHVFITAGAASPDPWSKRHR